MDNIIALKQYIRNEFNHKRTINTYEVFLNVDKAFDPTWIQGLLFKLSTKGVGDPILGWLHNLLDSQ